MSSDTTPLDQIDQTVWLDPDDNTPTVTGMEYLRRHIGYLPAEEAKALLALIEGQPYDKFYAKCGARRLWGRNVIPACGFYKEEPSPWMYS